MIESLAGLLVAISLIVSARQQSISHWIYSAALISLPLIYMGFAALTGDFTIVFKEAIVGLPFIVVGFLCLFFGFKASGYLVAFLWLVHGGYDIYHETLFSNSGVPSWYPLLCAVVDIVVAGYLFYSVSKLPDGNIRSAGIKL